MEVKKIVICLFDVLRRRKQRFFAKVLFTMLSRDETATKLVVRFNAIDSDFKTMRGVVGVQPSLPGSIDFLESTKAILKLFAIKKYMVEERNQIKPRATQQAFHAQCSDDQ